MPYSLGTGLYGCFVGNINDYKNNRLGNYKRYPTGTGEGYGADCVAMVADCWMTACPDEIANREAYRTAARETEISWNEIKAGDVLVRNSDWSTKSDHVAIIVEVKGNQIALIENTSWSSWGGRKIGEYAFADGSSMIGTNYEVTTKERAKNMGYKPFTCPYYPD